MHFRLLLLLASRKHERQLIQHGAPGTLPSDVHRLRCPWPPSMLSGTTNTMCICASSGAFRRIAYLHTPLCSRFFCSTAITCKTPSEPAAPAPCSRGDVLMLTLMEATAGRHGVIDEEPGEVGERLTRVAELALVDIRGPPQHGARDVGEALPAAHLVNAVAHRVADVERLDGALVELSHHLLDHHDPELLLADDEGLE
ncbi:hypothetical protein C2845_PM08G21320 [Panicum miliaceum]|uniref:Uncharacterized protein n=1 Tax=Panicum miliaceum TaxID=4540 RepID=A0A3L6R2X5_PANMI|nr:hypothetical protein C2845_PM08G21320 [Panicum miliaceum]